MKKTVIIMIILSFVGRISGFLREVFMAWRFGATIHTDTYIAALTVPVLIMSFVTIGLGNSLIPVLASAEKKGKREEFFNKLLSTLMIIAVIFMVLIIILARPLNMIVVRGFAPEDLNRVIYYSRMLAIVALFQILAYALMGYLQQNNRFYFAATASIPMNFGTILGAIVTQNPNSITILVIGTIIGYFMQLLWVMYPLIRAKYKFEFKLDFKDEHFKMLGLLIIPVIITLSANQINGIINRALASGLGEGSISLMNYASKVNGLFYQTLVVTLSTVLFTRQAKLSSNEDYKGIYQVTRQNLSSIMMLIVPIMLGTMFLATEVMQLIFQRGEFTADDSFKGGMVLMFYTPSLIAMSASELMSKMFFSLKQSKKPMISTVTAIGLNIILNLLVYKTYGINGLAAATTFSSLVGASLLGLMARKQFHKEGVRFWTSSYLKYIIAGAIMIAILIGFKLTIGANLSVIPYTVMCGLIGAITYFAVLYALKTEEMTTVLGQLKQRLKRS